MAPPPSQYLQVLQRSQGSQDEYPNIFTESRATGILSFARYAVVPPEVLCDAKNVLHLFSVRVPHLTGSLRPEAPGPSDLQC